MHFPLDGGNRVLSPSSHSQDVQIEDFEIFKFLSHFLLSRLDLTTFKALTLSNFSPKKMEQSKNCLDFATLF